VYSSEVGLIVYDFVGDIDVIIDSNNDNIDNNKQDKVRFELFVK
jgi:hypothetical protein